VTLFALGLVISLCRHGGTREDGRRQAASRYSEQQAQQQPLSPEEIFNMFFEMNGNGALLSIGCT